MIVLTFVPSSSLLLQASDPDVVDEGQLEYSLVSGSPYFDVDASSGLVFVVSVVDLSGQAHCKKFTVKFTIIYWQF